MNEPTPQHRVWLLALVPNIPFGRPLAGLVILITLLGWFWAAGIFFDGDTRSTSGAAAFFAVILAYIVPVFHYITGRTRQAFDDLAPHLDMDVSRIDAWRRSIDHKGPRWTGWNLSIGVAAWLAHTALLLGDPPEDPSKALHGAAFVAIVAGPGLVWIVMTCTVGALIDNARVFRRLAAHIRIDLINPAPLTAFARVAVSSTLALIGAQAAFPIMWLGPTISAVASIPGLIVISVAMLMLFILPIWPIHRAIVAAKRAELARINGLLSAARAAGASEPLDERIGRLNPYLLYRREIAGVHDWPFDTGVLTRLAVYLIIPPLTWVGAAFIDVAVARLM
jgi:hypothetical protein